MPGGWSEQTFTDSSSQQCLNHAFFSKLIPIPKHLEADFIEPCGSENRNDWEMPGTMPSESQGPLRRWGLLPGWGQPLELRRQWPPQPLATSLSSGNNGLRGVGGVHSLSHLSNVWSPHHLPGAVIRSEPLRSASGLKPGYLGTISPSSHVVFLWSLDTNISSKLRLVNPTPTICSHLSVQGTCHCGVTHTLLGDKAALVCAPHF